MHEIHKHKVYTSSAGVKKAYLIVMNAFGVNINALYNPIFTCSVRGRRKGRTREVGERWGLAMR